MKLGDDKELRVEGQGTIAISSQQGEGKLLHNVQFIPSLAHNLISVGQLLANGYSVNFHDTICYITDKKTGRQVASVYKTLNNTFPLELTNGKKYGLTVRTALNTKLWHQRFGHINAKSLKLLKNRNMVHGMPTIQQLPLCQSCAFGN